MPTNTPTPDTPQVVTPGSTRGLAPRTQQTGETRHGGSQDDAPATPTILTINPTAPEPALIAQAAAILAQGAPAVFPTDTVYGLGLAAAPTATTQAIYLLKHRDPAKSIPWLVDPANALAHYATSVPPYAQALAQAFWPGALTLVLPASAAVPSQFRAADGTIALRAPASPIVLALIRSLGTPLATSSANVQGATPAVSRATIAPTIARQVALIVDGGPTPGPVPSTIVSCLAARPQILREGVITARSIAQAC
jgi:L-threonylcarbamoyladenylate synthase